MKRVDVFELNLHDGRATVAGENAGYYRPSGSVRMTPYEFRGTELFSVIGEIPQRQLMQDALNKLIRMGYRIVSITGAGLGNTYYIVAEPVAPPMPPVGEAMSDD